MDSRLHLIDDNEVESLIADHEAQRRLCGTLEGMADALPLLPSSQVVREVGQQLATYSSRQSSLETRLFDRLFDAVPCPTFHRIIGEMRRNHAMDALHADDLAIELGHMAGSRIAAHPGELAYMLRCFFDGCRRAVAFEKLALLKLGNEQLTPAARSAILDSFHSI